MRALAIVFVREHLCEREVAQILGLVDLTVIKTEGEEVVKRMAFKVIVVRKESELTGKVRTQGIVFHPEHGVARLTTEITHTVEHRTDCFNICLHGIRTAVELPFLDDIISQHLSSGDISLFNDKLRIFFSRPFPFLCVYPEAFQHIAHLEFVLIRENLTAIKIFVCRNLTVNDEAQNNAEKVFITIHHILGEIKRGVLNLGEVKLSINLTHIFNIGIMGSIFLKQRLHTVRYAGGGVLCLAVVFGTPSDAACILNLSEGRKKE